MLWSTIFLNIKLLNKNVISKLNKSGWYQNRKYENAYKTISEIESTGYQCFDYAKEIIESFGGIFIPQVKKQADLDFSLEADTFDIDDKEYFQQIVGCRIFPICICHQFNTYVGEDKKIYLYTKEIKIIAGTFEDFLNKI